MQFPGRTYPIGAEPIATGGVHFRVWAPKPSSVTLVLEDERGRKSSEMRMSREPNGYWNCLVTQAAPGDLYRFRLGDAPALYPDPASRFQPQGPHGPSQIVDAHGYEWADKERKGMPRHGCVVYEMHIGTFTQEGTFQAAAARLHELADLGINVLEVMPVAEFDGSFGWGYDGVALFAPYHHYGMPDDFRAFVDRAHALGMGVILDVVYNHFGPSGCYHRQYADDYFTDRYECEWGDPINFDGENAGPVRELFLANAAYWIEEFHLDGLRMDATQQMFDASEHHIVSEIAQAVRKAAKGRLTYIIGENEPQHSKVARPVEQGGFGLDAMWNDDFHHSALVALKGRTEAYLTDYRGTPQEFISAAKHGYLYQGQWYRWQGKRRGTPASDLSPCAFITFLQNHDQIANSGLGKRIHQVAHPGQYRAMTALLLLGPATPMLFQGQEFGASSPFLYFADHRPELAELVEKGRTEFVHQFPSLAGGTTQPYLFRPQELRTFHKCKLDFSEKEKHPETYTLHRDLLKLRKEDPVFSRPRSRGVDGAVLSDRAFVLRFFGDVPVQDRLLLINLGSDLSLSPVPEPLLAPPEGGDWQLLWASEHPRYGGQGIRAMHTDASWVLSGYSAMVLIATNS
jgi:maltooligosyltrehalose trehalohydrolase